MPKAELRQKRLKLLALLDAQFANVCESHNRRDITTMNEALDRMLATIIAMRDPTVNVEKRRRMIELLSNASGGTDPLELGVGDAFGKSCYIRGDLDLDKLCKSVVWVKPMLTIEMERIQT